VTTDLRDIAARLRDARRVTILTGAGVSAASGVPTFRAANGLWMNVRPEILATPEAFARDPRLVWEWYDWRRQALAHAQPNAAHHVLARWTRERPGVTLITQNVDGLHERAGSERVVRLHGSIWRVRCWNQCRAGDWLDETVPHSTLPPVCPHCGGMVRPAVVWFGEPLAADVLASAQAACACDVFLAVGTSAVVFPAAGLVYKAKRRSAFTVEINPEATEVSDLVDVSIRGAAEDVLPRLTAYDSPIAR
jgi:NAD-dependent deacetylase